MSQVGLLLQYFLQSRLPKDIRFEHGVVKLSSCPGRHQASLRPWVWWILQQIISRPYPVRIHCWVSILVRVLHENVKFYFKVITQLKLIASPNKYFVFVE